MHHRRERLEADRFAPVQRVQVGRPRLALFDLREHLGHLPAEDVAGRLAPAMQRIRVGVGEPAVLIERVEGIGDALEDLDGPRVRLRSFRLGPHGGGDVEEGQHRPGDVVLHAAVGEDPDQVARCAIGRRRLAFDHAQGPEHPADVVLHLRIGDPRGDVADWPPHVGFHQMEDVRGAGREALYPQLVVQEQRGDLGALEQVLQVAVGPRQFVHPTVQLAVDRLQLLIDRLQLLLGGLQLLVG